jgi:hypothetical protein
MVFSTGAGAGAVPLAGAEGGGADGVPSAAGESAGADAGFVSILNE